MTTTKTDELLRRASKSLAAYSVAMWPPFQLPQHIRYVIHKLEAVLANASASDRLILCMPPRHGKSVLTSTLLPAFALGQHPEWSVITASYGQDLALDFGRRVRSYMTSPLHQMIFPNSAVVNDNAAAYRFGTMAGGSYYALGVGGPITGRGADVLIIDDPQKNAEDAYSSTARSSLREWYEQVAYTRLQPGGRIILIQTRWHQDDLAGWLLREHASDNWDCVSLPALCKDAQCDALHRSEGQPLWPERFPLEALSRIRTAIGSSAWSALYQQRPVSAEGSIFKPTWLTLTTFAFEPSQFSRLIFSLDTAFKTGEKNDYSVIAVWGECSQGTSASSPAPGYYLLDVVRERLDFPSLKSRVLAKAAYWKPHAVLIEDAASGQSLIQTLKLETTLPILPVKPVGDKESRASAVSPLFESRRVFLPQAASWLADYIDEVTSFPAAPHDDQVDATTQALSWMRGQVRSYTGYQSAVALRSATNAEHSERPASWSNPHHDTDPDLDGFATQSHNRSAIGTKAARRRWGKWNYY
jgi:predicted phage terminase large subunit-like protein